MCRGICAILLVAVVAALTLSPAALAQGKDAGEKIKSVEPKEKQYFSVFNPTLIEQNATEYSGKDIQLPDRFAKELSSRDYNRMVSRSDRRRLEKEKFSAKTHHIFRTQAITGSNMLCFAPRDNDEVGAFFEKPLVDGTKVYLMGRVGSRIYTEEGSVTLFMADRVAVGHAPPKKIKPVKKKPIYFWVEYDVTTATGTVRRKVPFKFKIPEPGKTYEIPDPYNSKQKLYLTFEF